MGIILSVSVGKAEPSEHASTGVTAIGKRPMAGPVTVRAPGAKGTGGSGLVGDEIGDRRHHGGDDQAVYAYAVEDLDSWAAELGRPLPHGCFGENLTTSGLDLNGTPIGQRWRVGERVVLEVTAPRTPCRTFAGHLGERGWVRRFTERGRTGAYLRVIVPGEIAAGDPVRIVHQPDHDVTVELVFRALTTERESLPRLLAAGDALHGEALRRAREAAERVG
ncbi:MOSC domain-containing protein YiiM [Amycolatopsis arida]|uniref:MOSC domain-containing protein YiiM n=1 Tax=Amycolatopsis arida TaxID=587909 RepID=A0A1I5XIZ0_9PSEU|nr:MOSC domain-containing protein [Amycolatopsis arida]TDX97417.1 MOSC domain-containing protein YiiM [Amycolatopsis arida]SFQ31932.1 MOSC domain-containing protein YiiM [Amycolatopsis arida]